MRMAKPAVPWSAYFVVVHVMLLLLFGCVSFLLCIPMRAHYSWCEWIMWSIDQSILSCACTMRKVWLYYGRSWNQSHVGVTPNPSSSSRGASLPNDWTWCGPTIIKTKLCTLYYRWGSLHLHRHSKSVRVSLYQGGVLYTSLCSWDCGQCPPSHSLMPPLSLSLSHSLPPPLIFTHKHSIPSSPFLVLLKSLKQKVHSMAAKWSDNSDAMCTLI